MSDCKVRVFQRTDFINGVGEVITTGSEFEWEPGEDETTARAIFGDWVIDEIKKDGGE